jgi:hypothetical protein
LKARLVLTAMLGLRGVISIFVSVATAVDCTVSDTFAERVRLPPVAVTVMGNVPVAASAAAVKFRVDVPEPGEGIVAGVNVTTTPLGTPDAESVTALLKDPNTCEVTPTEALFPRCTLTDGGATEMARSGVLDDPMTYEAVAVLDLKTW